VAWVAASDVAGSGPRADVVVASADGSAPGVVTAEAGAASIGSYGGGVWCWVGFDHLAVVDSDGRLVLVPSAGGPVRVLSDQGRAAAPAASPDGAAIAFVLERDDACDVVVVPVVGGASGGRGSSGRGSSGGGSSPSVPVPVSHADYAWDPAWAPDGSALAWHEWDLTGMSWDESRIVVADPDGSRATVVAGGEGTSVGQPRFSPDGGALAYVSDATGWWNVWVADAAGHGAAPLLAEELEHAEPAWGPGQRSFAWSPDGAAVALCRNEGGFASLVVTGRTGTSHAIAKGWHHGLDWGGGGIVAVRSGARTTPAVTVVDPAKGDRRVLACGAPVGFEAAGLVEPEAVSWPGRDGGTVHGLWLRPEHSARGDGTAPPVLVDVHGGPTGQAGVQWKPWHQYFVTRGWAVLAPDPRGSTGYGRAYTQALAGRWGVLDVEDCAAGLAQIGPARWGDPERVAVTGSSAGGLTALLLAALHGERLRAVVSRYGVTDLLGLAETTHRFESRYLDRIVGVLPRDADRYRDRSPVTHASEIRIPTLVLQGDADRVVPPAQAAALVDAIRAAGGTVEHHVYEGEGHGFSREETILDMYARTEEFLRTWVLES
jgi:dipeptidyl aminopeptidase/acylaminoacyl peptidase